MKDDLRTCIKKDLDKALEPIANKWLSSGYGWLKETKEYKAVIETLAEMLED